MPQALFFLTIALALQGLKVVPYKFQNFFSISVQNTTEILIRIVLHPQSALGVMDTVTSSNSSNR